MGLAAFSYQESREVGQARLVRLDAAGIDLYLSTAYI